MSDIRSRALHNAVLALAATLGALAAGTALVCLAIDVERRIAFRGLRATA